MSLRIHNAGLEVQAALKRLEDSREVSFEMLIKIAQEHAPITATIIVLIFAGQELLTRTEAEVERVIELSNDEQSLKFGPVEIAEQQSELSAKVIISESADENGEAFIFTVREKQQ